MRRDCPMPPRWARRRGPPPFVRRMGCAFASLLLLALFGASTLVSMLFRDPQRVKPALGIAAILLAALIAGFIFSIRRAGRFFRAQDDLRRQLMADVAHELRTPLSILQGRIEGLIDGVYPRDDERLGELLDETRHLSRLVDDLRTIANAEAGALELRKEKFDLAELIRDAAASFNRIEVDAPAELTIEADPLRIREVLLNLLSNAVRHAEHTRIHAEGHGRQVVIRVSDDGPGIPPDELPHIFDRFRKGRDSHGSGLGLAIARNLVLAHGGTIDARSGAGEGTTVTVTLPR